MNSTVIAFNIKIKQLVNHLIISRNLNNEISDMIQNGDRVSISLRQILSQSERKVFDYKLSILILYGAFENFVENIILSYLEKLNLSIEQFDDLPDEIKNSHTELSARLLEYIHAGYGKYDQITEEEVVKRLYSCICNSERYRLNTIAYTHHSSNLRIDVVRELFNGVGLKGIDKKIVKEKTFLDKMKILDDNYSEDMNQKIILEKAFFRINEIVERRNDIAHGVDDADENILSINVILDYCDYFTALAETIYSIVMKEYISFMINKRSKIVHELGLPINIYGKNIVCLNNKNNQIRKGNYLAAKNSKDVVRVGRIVSIEIDGKQVDYISNEVGIDFGAKVDFQVHIKDTYYLIDL